MGEPKSITIHEARQHADGLLYLRIGGRWYRLKTSEPPRGETTAVHLVDPQAEADADGCGHDDDRREALAWASRQFRLVGIEDMHAIGDVVLELADRYLAWLRRGSDG
jgi:hypothetical protein